MIIVGHTRHKAALELGLETVPVHVADNLTEKQIKAYRILDNKTGEVAEWDDELLAIELEDLSEFDFSEYGFEFDDTKKKDIDTSDDDVPESQSVALSQLGDIWICGQHRVMCGDSSSNADMSRFMIDKCDLYICDPPYGVFYADKNRFLNSISPAHRIQEPIPQDHGTPEAMKEFWTNLFNVAKNFAKDDSSYYLFGPQGGDLMTMMMSIKDAGWLFKHCLIWVKNNHVLGRCDYNYKHEPILFGWSKKHNFYGSGSCCSLLEHDKPAKSDLHPTMKPVSLIMELIQNSSKEQDLVLDSCLGSGTTLIACERLNRICYGCEISPNYVDVILRRFYKETGVVPYLEATGEPFPVE